MRIIHLFADLCNLYGDYGNVCGLKRALENKGQNVEIEYQSIDDEIDVYRFCYRKKSEGCT